MSRSSKQPAETECITNGAVWRSSTAVALLCFAVMNVALFLQFSASGHGSTCPISKALKETKDRTFSWWTAKAYVEEDKAPDVAVIGSSQMGSATFAADAQLLQQKVDILTHRRAVVLEQGLGALLGHRLSVFNCAQGGFMISDAYVMSRALFSCRHKPKLVIIGVSPRDFMDNSMDSASTTEPFQFYSRCIKLGKLAIKSFANPLSYCAWVVANNLPLRQVLEHTSPKLDPLPDRTDSTNTASHQNQSIKALSDISGDLKPGVLMIPANIPESLQDNTNEYEHRYHDAYPPVYSSERQFFRELLIFLRQSDIKVVVVGMPTLWTTRALLPDKFWGEFKTSVAQTCHENGARWIDLLDAHGFDANDFLDTVHLNAWGGEKLFNIGAQAIGADSSLVACLNQVPDRHLAGTRLPDPTQ